MSLAGRNAVAGTTRRYRGRHLAVAVAIVVFVAGLALAVATRAAGGRTRLQPVAAIVHRDNAICARYAAQIGEIAVPQFDPGRATRAELPMATRYLDKVVPRLQSERREIDAEGRPETSIDLYQSMLTALTAVVGDEHAAWTAASAGNLRAFRAALRADQSDGTHLFGLAHQFGVDACVSG